jgi:hypothetical protein
MTCNAVENEEQVRGNEDWALDRKLQTRSCNSSVRARRGCQAATAAVQTAAVRRYLGGWPPSESPSEMASRLQNLFWINDCAHTR